MQIANVSYRLHPEILLKERIFGEEARLLQRYFSPGTIELVERAESDVEAVVANPRLDSNSRNVKHDERLRDKVTLGRRQNHFIFTIESLGVVPPYRLFKDAINLLKTKAQIYIDEIGIEKC